MKEKTEKAPARQNSALIYKVLLDHASDTSPLPIKNSSGDSIEGFLEEDYGVSLNDHTVSDILHGLKEFGLVNFQGEKRGKWFPVREMDSDSATILLLSLYENNNLTRNQIDSIADLLYPVMGDAVTKEVQATMPKGSTSWNRLIPTLIGQINDAIQRNVQIAYIKNLNSLDNSVFSPDPSKARRNTVNPLGITAFRGDFYLIYSKGGKDQITAIRLDNINSIEATHNPRILPENFSLAEWLEDRPYPFFDPIEEFEVTATPYNEHKANFKNLTYIRQYFGNKPKLWLDSEGDGKVHAKIRTSRQCFLYWYVSYAEFFEIVSPEDMKEQVKEYARKMISKNS